MVAFDQNMLYIIIGVILVVIILLAVFMRKRRSKEGPSNINQFLAKEAELKKVEIAEREVGYRPKTPLYLKRPQDNLNDIRETTSELQHKNVYHNKKIEDKLEHLETKEKNLNLQKQVKKIDKKYLELNKIVKPKEGK